MSIMDSKAVRWMITFMTIFTLLFVGVAGAVYATFQISINTRETANKTESNQRSIEENQKTIETALNAIEKAAREAEDATVQSKKNEDLLNIVLAITGCTKEDTPEACAQRVSTAGQQEGNRRILEVDCRIRRALANQPAPEGAVCIPQSP